MQNGTPLFALQELGGWATAKMVRRYARRPTHDPGGISAQAAPRPRWSQSCPIAHLRLTVSAQNGSDRRQQLRGSSRVCGASIYLLGGSTRITVGMKYSTLAILFHDSAYQNVSNLLILWWPGRELNPRHADFQSAALPTELPGRPDGSAILNSHDA